MASCVIGDAIPPALQGSEPVTLLSEPGGSDLMGHRLLGLSKYHYVFLISTQRCHTQRNVCNRRNENGETMRAGAQTLTLLGAPRNVLILEALAEGPMGQLDLRRAAGSPAQSTLRGHTKALEECGAMTRRRRDTFPGTLEYELTEPGRELLDVASHLQHWLGRAPREPLELGSDAAKAAIKGLVDGWLARMLAPLADSPLSLTELDKRLSALSYPTIERRLETMRLAEQVVPAPRKSAGTPYAPTRWLRFGVAPLAAASRWEHRRQPEAASPITRLEVASALSIAGPLLELEGSPSGLLQTAVKHARKRKRSLGVIEVDGGTIASFGDVYPRRKPDAWASGTADAWFSAILDGDQAGLRLDGDECLSATLLNRIHDVLFAEPVIPDAAR